MKRMGKKGQQMTLGTIIAIVLGIAVLVFLIFGFATGWNNLWDTITEMGGGDVNVDDVVRGCAVACASENIYAYCNQERVINLEGEKSETGTCGDFKESDERYGISCSSFSCESTKSIVSSGEKAVSVVPSKEKATSVVPSEEEVVNTVPSGD